MKFLNYLNFNEYLDGLGLFSMDLNLDRMDSFIEKNKTVKDIKSIHIVGTNGKGSVSSYLTSMSLEAGLKVGTFTSPHFVTPRERITINGKMLCEEEWVEIANEVYAQTGEKKLTYFEFLTCMGFVAFERHGVDIAIMESGLGGRYDATKVIVPDVTIFTPFGLDHEKVLGGTLELIADDKSDAMHEGSMAVSAIQKNEAKNILIKKASSLKATLNFIDDFTSLPNVEPQMAGKHQKENARLAVCGFKLFCEKFKIDVDDRILQSGVSKGFIPGRLQIITGDQISRNIILDGAHNLHAFEALMFELEKRKFKPDHIIFSCMRDKNVGQIITMLESFECDLIGCLISGNERAASEGELKEFFNGKLKIADGIKSALEMTKSGSNVLICGSLYLLSLFYTTYPQFLKNPYQN